MRFIRFYIFGFLLLSYSSIIASDDVQFITKESYSMKSGSDVIVDIQVIIPTDKYIIIKSEDENDSSIVTDFKVDPKYGFSIHEILKPKGKKKKKRYILAGKDNFKIKLFDLKGLEKGKNLIPIQIITQLCDNTDNCTSPSVHQKQITFNIISDVDKTFVATRDTSGIKWESSLDNALAKAKQSNQNVFLLISTSWCGACKWLDKNTLSKSTVRDLLNKKFIPVKISEYGDIKKCCSSLGFGGYPTVIIMTPDKKVLHNEAGAYDERSFINKANSHAKDPSSIQPSDTQNTYADLNQAIKKGNLQLVQNIVSKGSSVNEKDSKTNTTHLMTAASVCNQDIVKYLLDKKSEINAQNIYGWTALHYAAQQGPTCEGVIRSLNKRGIDRKLKTKDGKSAFYIASAQNHNKILSLLVTESEIKPPKIVTNTSKELSKLDKDLFAACEDIQTNSETIQTLIGSGARVNIKNSEGLTPIFVAIRFASIEVVEALLKNGADPSILINENSGYSDLGTLHFAAMRSIRFVSPTNKESYLKDFESSLRIAQLLINKGVNINQVAKNMGSIDKTPLIIAASLGNSSLVRHLLEKGANVNHKINTGGKILDGFSALHYAIVGVAGQKLASTQEKIDVLSALIQYNSDVNAAAVLNNSGQKISPLDLSLRFKIVWDFHSPEYSDKVISMLKDAGAK